MGKKLTAAFLILAFLLHFVPRVSTKPNIDIHNIYLKHQTEENIERTTEDADAEDTANDSLDVAVEIEPELPARTIDKDKPMVAITFDDGPGNGTQQILDILSEYDSVATFFVIGKHVEQQPELLKAIVDQGSVIGNHTWSHKNLRSLSKDQILSEIQAVDDIVNEICGISPAVIRAPFGEVNDDIRNIAAETNRQLINWTVDPRDWSTKDANQTYDAIMNSVENGSIILVHDYYSETAEAMVLVIPELLNQGYQLVTIPELLEFGPK